MMTINAVGKDGASILPDLDGASPTGGLVTSASMPGFGIAPGDVLRHFGEWVVVAAVSHSGVTGLTRLSYVAASSDGLGTLSMWRGQSCELRTDCRIDPDTLYKIAPRWAMAATA